MSWGKYNLNKKLKILIGPSSFGELDASPIKKLEGIGFEVISNPYKRKISKEELFSLLPGIDGIIAGLEPLDREVMERSDLKVISRCGSGLSNVDMAAAKELGIAVRNTPLAPVAAVAEVTIGCLLSLLRQIPQMNLDLHNRQWNKKIGRQLNGMKIAIIGFGNIGQMVGKLLSVFGAKIFAVDSNPIKVDGANYLEMDSALRIVDATILHCSGEKCILGRKEFDQMKKGAYILNAARGGLIDEEALKESLENNKIAGAWLDTFGNEPYCGPLCDYAQVILTPHIGSYTMECRKNMEIEAVNNLIQAFKL